MKSYNDNLYSSIVTALNLQELEMQKIAAKIKVSKSSISYKQKNTFVLQKKLNATVTLQEQLQKILNEIETIKAFSTNVLTTTNASKKIVAEAISNAAVAAANTQISANAIVKLAADIGSVFNIINAGDFESEMYNYSEYAYKIITETAFLSEKTSELGMDTSSSTAGTNAIFLANTALATDTAINNLLKVTKVNFTATNEEFARDHRTLVEAQSSDKAAEGLLKQQKANFAAINDAFNLFNKELNLNLTVLLTEPEKNKGEFSVTFNNYTSAFPYPENLKQEKSAKSSGVYPVESYALIFVKANQKSIFSLAEAENIISEDETTIVDGTEKYRYVKITPTKNKTISSDNKNNEYYKKLLVENLLDADGKKLQLDKNYVVFVFATFLNDYKRLINNFEDYLSAPSKMFCFSTSSKTEIENKNVVSRIKNCIDVNDTELLTRKKKAKIAALTQQIFMHQNKVSQSKEIVALLTQNLNQLENQINSTERKKSDILENTSLHQEVLHNAANFMKISKKTHDEILASKQKVEALSKNINSLIQKLIYSADYINKLSDLIIRKKGVTPLISDELVATITNAENDANNAVALTLEAIASVSAAQSSIFRSESALELNFLEATQLLASISRKVEQSNASEKGIQQLLDEYLLTASSFYNSLINTKKEHENELHKVNSDLNNAQFNL